MHYDRRSNGTYLITGDKHNNKDIVVKMGSTISEIHLIENFSRSSHNLQWILEEHQEDDLLTLKGTVDNEGFFFDINKSIVTKQFCKMIKQNKTLDSCSYLTTLMQKSFSVIFKHFLINKGEIICSNIPTEAYIQIEQSGKILGTASRFNFTAANKLQLYEYVGKEIDRDFTAIIMLDGIEVKFSSSMERNISIYNPNEQVLGYMEVRARVTGIKEYSNERTVPEINLLPKVPLSFTNPTDMNVYIVTNNTSEDITSYKISMKPRAETININRFMLREFTI